MRHRLASVPRLPHTATHNCRYQYDPVMPTSRADKFEIVVAGLRFMARLETGRAPKTCALFISMLPIDTKIIQARWSGEACWIPFGDLKLDLGYENHTSFPAPGQLLFYPGG